MKIKTLAVSLCLTLMTSSAFAQWFPVNAHVTWNNFQVTAQVANNFGFLVRCQGNVFGINQFGLQKFAWFDQVIPAGQYRFAAINALPGEYFVNGFARINCIQ